MTSIQTMDAEPKSLGGGIDADDDGIDPDNPLHATGPRPKRLFSYDWAQGFVSPFRGGGGTVFTTPALVIDGLLDMLVASGCEHMVDLGSGDGRCCIAAARRGLRALGVELDAALVTASAAAAAAEGLACEFRCSDITSQACLASLPTPLTAVAYQLPAALQLVATALLSLHSAGRLLSISWACEEPRLRLMRKLEIDGDDGRVWRVYDYAWAVRGSNLQPSALPSAEATLLKLVVDRLSVWVPLAAVGAPLL